MGDLTPPAWLIVWTSVVYLAFFAWYGGDVLAGFSVNFTWNPVAFVQNVLSNIVILWNFFTFGTFTSKVSLWGWLQVLLLLTVTLPWFWILFEAAMRVIELVKSAVGDFTKFIAPVLALLGLIFIAPMAAAEQQDYSAGALAGVVDYPTAPVPIGETFFVTTTWTGAGATPGALTATGCSIDVTTPASTANGATVVYELTMTSSSCALHGSAAIGADVAAFSATVPAYQAMDLRSRGSVNDPGLDFWVPFLLWFGLTIAFILGEARLAAVGSLAALLTTILPSFGFNFATAVILVIVGIIVQWYKDQEDNDQETPTT